MKIFRVAYFNNSDSSQGFDFFTNKAEAERELKKWEKDQGDNFDDRSGIDVEDIAIGKYEFLKLLKKWASHPDNG